jgi:hypothetical protein
MVVFSPQRCRDGPIDRRGPDVKDLVSSRENPLDTTFDTRTRPARLIPSFLLLSGISHITSPFPLWRPQMGDKAPKDKAKKDKIKDAKNAKTSASKAAKSTKPTTK